MLDGADIDSNNDQGAAYVFDRDIFGNWNEVDKLVASDGAANDRFGNSVSISGLKIIVGADAATVDGNDGQGAAYIFEK